MVYKRQSIYTSSSLRNSSLSERLEQFSSSIYCRSPTQLLMYSRPLSTCGVHYHLNKVIPWCILLTLQLWCIVLAHLSLVLLLLTPLVIVSRIKSHCLLVLHWLFFSYYHQARPLQEQILQILLWNATKIHTVDGFVRSMHSCIAAIGDVIDVIIFALSRAYLSILCATFGPSMLSNFFELILLLQTLLYCMTTTVAVHAVADSCCLPVVSVTSTAPKIICVWFVVVVCSPCITTLLCISYISCLSWLQILECSVAITLQLIKGIIQDSS